MRLRTGLWRSSHYFREIVQDDDLYYSVMATEIPLKVSYCQRTALYLSCPVIILRTFASKQTCCELSRSNKGNSVRIEVKMTSLDIRILKIIMAKRASQIEF